MNVVPRLALLALLSWASAASSWNSPGHQGVGYIADQILVGTNTAKDVRQILGTNLKTASVWADCAKGVTHSKQTGKFSYTVNPKYQECAPYETVAGQKLMKDYVARNWDNCNPAEGEDPCHKQYHYTDVSIEHNTYSVRTERSAWSEPTVRTTRLHSASRVPWRAKRATDWFVSRTRMLRRRRALT